MESFENDFRFSRPPDGQSSDAGLEDDEPIFGAEDSFMDHQQYAGSSSKNSNWRRRYRPAFDEDSENTTAGLQNNGDAAFDESFQVGPSSDENTELYAILNLDKAASTQDVLRSYRSLAVSFQ